MTGGALIGQVVAGRYRVERRLGEGGMGAVYRAIHLPSGRAVALKTLATGVAATREIVGRFEREAKATSALDHPNIIEVLDLGRLPDGGLFMAMELAEGDSVGAMVARGPLAPRRALVLARQALDALAYAHERGVIHRDIKPDNLMVVAIDAGGGAFERLKVLDFGLAKLLGPAADEHGHERLTATGVVSGTPAYIAPEQALGRPVDGRADLYALGAVLFEMLSGRPPFEDPDPLELVRLQVTAAPPPLAAVAPGAPWCTPALEALVARALAKRPDERFADATAMQDALDAAFLSLDHLG